MKRLWQVNLNGVTQKIMTEEKGSEWYDMIYQTSDEYAGSPEKHSDYALWLEITKRISPVERVLELGCGTGQFASVLINAGKQYVLGIDFSEIGIRKARELNPGANFVQGNLYDRSIYPKSNYDTVIAIETMEHLGGDLEILKIIPSGIRVIFTVPNYICLSHVNAFLSSEGVSDRYGSVIDIMNLDEWIKDKKNDWKLFIVDGIRTGEKYGSFPC